MSPTLRFLAVILASYAILNLVVALAVVVWGRWARVAHPDSRFWFALHLLPSFVTLTLVGGLVVPAFAELERWRPEETGPVLLVCGVAGVLLILSGLWRGWRAWRATLLLERTWRATASPLDVPSAAMPAWTFDHEFPVAAVVGWRRPRLYLARQVVAACSAAELRAIVTHELAHVAGRDNVKGCVLRTLPDWLSATRLGDGLRTSWSQAIECAADARAVAGSQVRALDLAAAILKVARLVPPGARLTDPVSALCCGYDVAARVTLLVEGRSDGRGRAGARTVWMLFGLVALATPLLVLDPAVRVSVHELTEALVHLLA